ncbi:MAG: MEDS domain-containing protein, partial [Solirubrobacteraceae bacterium]
YAFADAGRRVVEPRASVKQQTAAAERAVARGFTGLRAIVDVTAVARTREQRDAMARFEYLIDRKLSVLAWSALCAYDAHALGNDGIAELACLHPFVNAGSTQFQLYADDDSKLVISGELDIACEELFVRALDRTMSLLERTEVIVECQGLTFADHRSLLALDAAARRRRTTIELRSPSGLVRRLAELLDMKHLRLADGGESSGRGTGG